MSHIRCVGVIAHAWASGPRYLLLKRTPQDGGFWQHVTGGVEEGEALLHAAARELREETGIDVEPCPMDYVYEFEASSVPHREDIFAVEIPTGQNPALPPITLSDEHTEFRWVDFPEALCLMKWPGNRMALRKLHSSLCRERRPRQLQAAIDRIREELAGNPAYAGAFLFGSLARGDFDEGSDLDVVVIVPDGPGAAGSIEPPGYSGETEGVKVDYIFRTPSRLRRPRQVNPGVLAGIVYAEILFDRHEELSEIQASVTEAAHRGPDPLDLDAEGEMRAHILGGIDAAERKALPARPGETAAPREVARAEVALRRSET